MTKKNERRWCVYKHTNKANNKVYIGLTCLNPKKRWKKNGKGYLNLNKNGSYNQPVMAHAILKYPDWNNGWTHEIIADNLTKEEANDLEIKLIAIYKSNCMKYNNPSFGYNMDDGGQWDSGMEFSEESRQKMSASAKERCTEKWAIENSQIQSGIKRPQCSNPCSAETKQIIKQRNSKAVYQKTLNGEIINEFASQSEAERVTGIAQVSIWKCCI